ncbi:adenosylcobinamide-phosphate synthase CbiB [Chloroflexus sp.]|uniref:adenosylcobinamide-phosphate synthase CbiB n=1 Tax=Chloroflexus sp. TaxID=1904827 RepID=UPI002ADDBC03|nr:adenosylcobinamide-phosphate synthase CbiB [Chloroflexus sp.]
MMIDEEIRRRCAIALLALVLDYALGDPPNQLHPVSLMGHWLRLGERLAPATPLARLAWGGGWLYGGWWLVGRVASRLPRHLLVQGACVSLLLAYRGLDRAVAGVEQALRTGNLAEARRLLGWHLVSRPTADLSAAEVAGAAIESLAENLSDSIIAPLLAFLVGGLPALAVYRLTNTADAMWGYRTERYEYLGKIAARCDDAFNLLPARMTALMIALATHLINRRGWHAWQTALRDARHTASPNAGWPMAAMAGALDTVLTKRDHYALGDGSCIPDAAMIGRARRIVQVAMTIVVSGLWIGILAGAGVRRVAPLHPDATLRG